MDDDWVTGEAVILDPVGLHARPAVKLTKAAKKFAATIEIQGDDPNKWVNAKSPNATMKLRAGYQTPLQIRASGSDAADAIAALQDLISRNFDA